MLDENLTKLKDIANHTEKAGASSVKIISTKDIHVDHKLADMCRQPRCENYGLSKNCPPHIPGPAYFIKKLTSFEKALFFKIDVPSKVLFSNERIELFQLLHEIASGVEQYAIKSGFINAEAYAGGSCKGLFCRDYPKCNQLSSGGKCRNPLIARPSMSGFGIDVARLAKKAEWQTEWVTHDKKPIDNKTANVYGLILLY